MVSNERGLRLYLHAVRRQRVVLAHEESLLRTHSIVDDTLYGH